ncbi:hypothetical protein M422DRAFT_37001 [Sphaerobolus stellatus SS14]|uniref:Unplaced genomic scaffold SPHSTscaffold_211, whole genome shotgun sequence n=1 Tax=Sphaerobolus stellatus (strain SS14) TaxID=990650 RepID=A0A0C9U4Q8_SPHS4|nr:hypothetical protein M422DRAFT_37001 [Sphaerobolus stellatus SS14]
MMSSLQTCVINPLDDDIPITMLLDALPVSVERIDITWWGSSGPQTWIDTKEKWEPSLRRLQNLTHLGNVFSLNVDLTETTAGMNLLLQLGSMLPRLLYVQVAGPADKWIMVRRFIDGKGEYELPSGTRIASSRWGGFFNGIQLRRDNRMFL